MNYLTCYPEEVFTDLLPGKNFMTPEVLTHWSARHADGSRLVCELSRGSWIRGQMIYGLTVIEVKPDGTTERRSDLSRPCDSQDEAREQWEATTAEWKYRPETD